MFLNEKVDIVLPIFMIFVNKEINNHKILITEILLFIITCSKSNDTQKIH